MRNLRQVFAITLFCLGAFLFPSPAQTQVNRADSAAVLLDATRRLESEGENAAAAELLDLIIRHFAGTPAASAAESLLLLSERTGSERSGRSSMIAFNTLYGAWLGAGIPAAFGAREPEPFGAGLLIGAPLGFFATKAFVDRWPMSSGQATLTGFGARWGTWQGIGWREVFDFGDRTVTDCYPGDGCYTWQDESERAPFTAAIVGGVAGLVTGGILAQSLDPSHGAATLIEHGAGWGTWFGLATSALVDIDYSGDEILTWTLLGGNAGLVAAALASRAGDVKASRVRIITAAGIAGGVGGLGLDLLIDVEDEKAAVLIPTVTSILGLIAGGVLTHQYDSGGPSQDGSGDGSSLVNLYGGSWSLGLPMPQPTAVAELSLKPGTKQRLGALFPLFSAEF